MLLRLFNASFTYVGYSPASGSAPASPDIAVWTGGLTGWHEVGGGTDGAVTSLDIDSAGDLYAGGEFTKAGGSPAPHANKWSGSAWSALGSGVGQAVIYEAVNALLVDGISRVIVGGRFEEAEDQRVNNLAQWDMSNPAWTGLDGGLGVNNTIDALVSYESTVFAAGGFSTAGAASSIGAARWGGSAWEALGSGAFYIHDLATPNGIIPYAGGAFSTAGGAPADNIARWNGAAWEELSGGTNGYVHALALDGSGGFYTRGEFTPAGDGPASNIAFWNGVVWTPLGDRLDGEVDVLAVDALGNLYAGEVFVNHIAMWDGSEWHALGSGTDDWVYALETDSDGRLYAGGYFQFAGGILANFVAMWNGVSWSALGDGMDGAVAALEVDGNGYVYAGSEFTQAEGSPASHVAFWDGFAWTALGSGVNGNVRALTLSNDGLVVGGFFSMAGEKPSTNIGLYSLPPAQPAPAPTLSALSASTIVFGGPDFTLVATGGISLHGRSCAGTGRLWQQDT